VSEAGFPTGYWAPAPLRSTSGASPRGAFMGKFRLRLRLSFWCRQKTIRHAMERVARTVMARRRRIRVGSDFVSVPTKVEVAAALLGAVVDVAGVVEVVVCLLNQ
jgi:hypothetical protein